MNEYFTHFRRKIFTQDAKVFYTAQENTQPENYPRDIIKTLNTTLCFPVKKSPCDPYKICLKVRLHFQFALLTFKIALSLWDLQKS